MTHNSSTAAADLPFADNLTQGGLSCDFQHRRYAPCFRFLISLVVKHGRPGNRPYRPHIQILDDYSLLNIFSFSRPEILNESQVDYQSLEGGEWNCERWWYRLVQVCRRWRYIVLESASRLRLSLLCARGAPVADMLAHSASLPLVIDHFFNDDRITAEDEEGITLALQNHDRVRRIRLRGRASILNKLVDSLDGEFPILEYLLIEPQESIWLFVRDNMNFLETFRAPHLRHLLLTKIDIPIGSPLLTTTASLVTLSFESTPLSAYTDPNALLQLVSLMPRLEILRIYFDTHSSNLIEEQLWRTPVMTRAWTHVTLPSLRWLGFKGSSAYLDVILPHVTLPLLEKLQVYFFNQWTYCTPNLRQYMSTAENLQPNTIELAFHSQCVEVLGYPHKEARMYTLSMSLDVQLLRWQVGSSIQIFQTLRGAFSAVERLTLKYDGPTISRRYIEPDRTQWRELLGSFVNVKTLFVDGRLVEQLSGALQPGTGESPTELLPELQELSCPAMDPLFDAFTPFIDARQKAGRHVTMINL